MPTGTLLIMGTTPATLTDDLSWEHEDLLVEDFLNNAFPPEYEVGDHARADGVAFLERTALRLGSRYDLDIDSLPPGEPPPEGVVQ